MDRLKDAVGRIRLLRATDQKVVGARSAIDTGSESYVQQQFARECDVNTIVERFGLLHGGGLPPALGGVYGDFTGITDYDSALARIEEAEAGFMALPAAVRERFDNSTATFLAWSNGRSLEDLVQLVAEPAAPVAPPAPPVVVPPVGG